MRRYLKKSVCPMRRWKERRTSYEVPPEEGRTMSCWKERRTANEVLPEDVCATNELLEGAEQPMRLYLRMSVRPMSCWKERRPTNEVLPEEVCATNELLERVENC